MEGEKPEGNRHVAGATSFIQPRVPKNAWKFGTLQLNPGPRVCVIEAGASLCLRNPSVPGSPDPSAAFQSRALGPPRLAAGVSGVSGLPVAAARPERPGGRGRGAAAGSVRAHLTLRRPGTPTRPRVGAAGRPRAPRSRSAPLDPTGVGPAAARRSSGLRRPGTSPGPRCRAAAGQNVRATRGRAQPERAGAALRPPEARLLAPSPPPARPPLSGGARNEPAPAPGCRSEGRGPATSHAAEARGLDSRGWARPGSGRRGSLRRRRRRRREKEEPGGGGRSAEEEVPLLTERAAARVLRCSGRSRPRGPG
ncbi:hypothetical protein LEMLEM_LOCUS9837 [Lemmus lemmus]